MLENPDQSLLEQIRRILRTNCGMEPAETPIPVVVGVSGGPDSVCLLHCLHRLDVALIVAHLDHGLRPESPADAEAVRRLAVGLGLPVEIERHDAAAFARTRRLSIEEAARDVRYRFLFRVAQAHHAQAVAVAHTADDQVETFLMHLLRGAGLSGLSGMAYRSQPNPWDDHIPLIRPLLNTWRVEVEAYLHRNELPAQIDDSNRDWRFYRNRLRGETLPYLETLNPGVRARFHQTAELLRGEDEALEAATAEAWMTCLATETPGALALDAARLRAHPLALQRRLLRRAAGVLRPGLRDIDFAAIQRAIEFLHSPTRSQQADWIVGLRLEMHGERLWLTEAGAAPPAGNWPQLLPGSRIELLIPGEILLPGGWQLRAETRPVTADLRALIAANSDPYRAWLDRAALPDTLLVRTRRTGERFRPLGMDGRSMKLSDFMINAGLPRQARAGWPLVVAGEEIAWVPGHRLADPFAIKANSASAVMLQMNAGP